LDPAVGKQLIQISIMAPDYKTYLAAQILSEEGVVCYSFDVVMAALMPLQITYRLLSKALKVHVNSAKQ
jgi:hypothetical protein